MTHCLFTQLYFKYGFSYRPLDQRGECWNFRGQKTPIRKRNGKGEEVQKKPVKRPDRGPNQPMVVTAGHPAPYKIGVGAGSFNTVKNLVKGLTLTPTAARSTAALELPEGHRRATAVLPSQRGQCRWRLEGRRYPPRTSMTPASTTTSTPASSIAPMTTPTEMASASAMNPMPLLAGLDLTFSCFT